MVEAGLIVLRAVAIALLLRIAWRDLAVQRIANRDVVLLAGAGIAALALSAQAAGAWTNLAVGAAAAAVLFLVLLPLWFLRKVGAGDVKLMFAAPLVSGGDHLLPFALFLLFFAVLVVALLRYPMLLPERLFRGYIEVLDRKGVVPFGVPIAASLVVVLLLQAGAGLR